MAFVTEPICFANVPSAGIVHGGPLVFELVAKARSSWYLPVQRESLTSLYETCLRWYGVARSGE